jgi:predicted NUDIX family NTP pyrophosphohydrolase
MKKSAGILLYRKAKEGLEVLLVHPGGPFYRNKDQNTWTIPKGEFEEGEDAFMAARREFFEETGFEINGKFIPLTTVKQNEGKWVHTWAIEGDLNCNEVKSNTFTIEWPPKSGKQKEFAEIDKAAWYNLEDAREKILKGQIPILDELEEKTNS